MDWEAIWERARNEFLNATREGDQGILLWEHSARVALNARRIVKLEEVRASNPDEAAIFAASLFHHSGWILQRRNEGGESSDSVLGPLSRSDREHGASLLEQCLKGLMSAESIARAVRAVHASGDRKIDSINAIVVAEADNLDEFGVLALWSTVRRGAIEGRGIQAAIDTWERQQEYRFWDARLNDSFRLAQVRDVAQERLSRFAVLMEQLAEEHSGADVILMGSSSPDITADLPMF